MKILKASDIRFKKRSPSSHKGDHGRVLVVGGSEQYVGAAALCGLAALRSGCDWATVAAPEKVAWAINCLTPDLVTVKLKGARLTDLHRERILNLMKTHDVLALGNGIGMHPQTNTLVHRLIRQVKNSGKPMVIDADALKMISLDEVSNTILTPHAKEFRTLMEHSGIKQYGESGSGYKSLRNEIPWKAVQKKLKGTVILLKGPTDFIVSRDAIIANTMHDPSMTVAGTGDVLAGLCAGFLAQGYPLFKSACMGAYFNGLTGKILAGKKKYPSLIASDIVQDIGGILERRQTFEQRFKKNQ